LGTSFNVDSRGEQVEVFLNEGKVKLLTDEDENNAITLQPGEKVKYNVREKIMEKTTDETMATSASWKEGILNFKNMEFREVLIKLTTIYGKDFECEDEALLGRPMYIGIPYADWDMVRQALELSMGVKFIESEGRYKVEKE
jgi:transmembrane sensor